MKKPFLIPALLLTIAVAVSCKKDSSNPTPTTGTFVINGTTYTETKGSYSVSDINDRSYAALGVAGTNGGKKGAFIILFPGSTKPAAGTYTIVSDMTTSTTGSKQVGIIASDSVSVAKEGLYTAQSGTVTVSVSSDNKLTITLPSTKFSGSNFDNTDPKNTNITDVTVTASGTVKEN